MVFARNIRNNLTILLVAALAVFSFVSLVRPGYFPMHDDMQVMRLVQLEKCFKDGQIPCRWVPDQGYGYGYPQFNFYSPLPYYVAYFFRWLGFNYLAAIKISFILSLLLSALAMLALGRWLWGNVGGAVAAIFYLYAPYRAMDIYNRGALAEAWAFVFLPLIFLGVARWVKENRRQDLVILSGAVAGLFMSHNITTLIALPFVAVWTLLWLMTERRWRATKGLVAGALVGFGLAAFFVLPAFLEKKYVHVETMLMGYFNYLAHFVSINQLLFSSRWGYGSSVLGPNEQVHLGVGVFHWLFAFVGLVSSGWLVGWGKNRRQKIVGLFLGLSFLVAIFFVHQVSSFVWNAISFLKWLQFPWRFLVLAVFFESLLAGLVFVFLSKRARRLVACLVVGLVIYANGRFFYPRVWLPLTDAQKLSGESWEEQQKISIFDYLPIWAEFPPAAAAPAEPWAVTGGMEVINFEKGTDWQKGELVVTSDTALVRLPLYYFPGMKLEVDERPARFNYQNDLGLISFELAAGQHSFRVRLTDTWPRRVGNWLSVGSIIIWGGWLSERWFRRRWSWLYV